jgi:hypothetical protein
MPIFKLSNVDRDKVKPDLEIPEAD